MEGSGGILECERWHRKIGRSGENFAVDSQAQGLATVLTSSAMKREAEQLQQPIKTVARKDFATLPQELTVQQALDTIRERGLGEKIVYFYVVDERERLVGVVPTRRLLTAAVTQRLRDIMVQRVVTIPENASVLEACEAFVLHKFLAFPVVDYQRRIVGVVDVNLLTEEVFEMAEVERLDELFEAIGF